MPTGDAEGDEDIEQVLAADFEIGHFIRERVIPRATLYFTEEANEDEPDDFADDEEPVCPPSPLSLPPPR